jgi:hypothetical protein
MDYCRHLQNCLLSYRHENKLIPHISTLIEQPQLLKKLSLAGEKEAATWTWERSVQRFENALVSFIKRR